MISKENCFAFILFLAVVSCGFNVLAELHISPGPLKEWQKSFAGKKTKNIHDYLMLLPEEIFHCELNEGPLDEKARDKKITENLVVNGYLGVDSERGNLQLALYKDTVNKRDVIGVVMNGGVGNMCNLVWFATWDDSRQVWIELDLLRVSGMNTKLKNKAWWPNLPKKGTQTDIIDENGKVILKLLWIGGRFEVK